MQPSARGRRCLAPLQGVPPIMRHPTEHGCRPGVHQKLFKLLGTTLACVFILRTIQQVESILVQQPSSSSSGISGLQLMASNSSNSTTRYGNMSSSMALNQAVPMANTSHFSTNPASSQKPLNISKTSSSSPSPASQQHPAMGASSSASSNSRLKAPGSRRAEPGVAPPAIHTADDSQEHPRPAYVTINTSIHSDSSGSSAKRGGGEPAATKLGKHSGNGESVVHQARASTVQAGSKMVQQQQVANKASKSSSPIAGAAPIWAGKQATSVQVSQASNKWHRNEMMADNNKQQVSWSEAPHQHHTSATMQPLVGTFGDLDQASLQLERPMGYSYESHSPMSTDSSSSSSLRTGYTHTSLLSPPVLRDQAKRYRQPQAHYYTEQISQQSVYGEPRSMRHGNGHYTATADPSLAGPRFSTGRPPAVVHPMIPVPHISVTGTAANPCRPSLHQQAAGAGGIQELAQTNILGPNEIGAAAQALPNFSSSGIRYLKMGIGTRLRSAYIFKVLRADSLTDCELACSRALAVGGNGAQDACRSFNYRAYFAAENCELSRYDIRSLKLEDGGQFEQNTQFDFYALAETGTLSAPLLAQAGSSSSPVYSAFPETDCLDVTQSCSSDGMEFTLRTTEPFSGRIYTYGFYDSCFFDGEGSMTSSLRISRSNGFPRCGTQQFGDLMTNIVVVQFNDYVQTTRDKKYNLTCYFSGPGEAVVTSNYLDTKIDERSHPMQIEHLPPQNVITSNVHLRVLYRGQPTNTIAVGDLLTFRLETRSLAGHRVRADPGQHEIFATNVIAKDPYSGRQVQLIDSRGCPIDPANVFPELQRTPDGALESEFYAFKIPDSNFLIFQATVRTCKSPCEPVICQSPSSSSSSSNLIPDAHRGQYTIGVKGGHLMALSGPSSAPSWGRKRRRRSADTTTGVSEDESEMLMGASMQSVEHIIPVRPAGSFGDNPPEMPRVRTIRGPELGEAEEEVKEMFRVYMSRAEMNGPPASPQARLERHRGDESVEHQWAPGSRLVPLPARLHLKEAHEPSEQALAGVEEQVCMGPSSYYAILFTVIVTSMILLSVSVVSLFVTSKRAKFRISQPASGSCAPLF